MPPNYKNLEKLLAVLDSNSMTHDEFRQAFDIVVKKIQDLRVTNEKEFKLMHNALDALTKKVKDEASYSTDEMRRQVEAVTAAAQKKMEEVLAKAASLKNGNDGKDAKPEEVAPLVVPLVLAALPKNKEETGDDIIKKINNSNRLIDKAAIEGFAQLEKDVAEKTGNTTRIGWGSHPLTVQGTGTTVDKNTRVINFKGTGVSSVVRGKDGVVAVTISGGGGGTASPLTTKGDIYTYDSADARLPVGADGTVLTADSASAKGVKWSAVSGTGTVTTVGSVDSSVTVTNPTTAPDLAVVKAPKWSTARNLAGNSVDGSANVPFANKFIVQGTADTGLSGAQFTGALATGIVKNTTTTGVLSIAAAGDFPTLNQNTTGTAAGLTTGRTIAITGDLGYTSPSFDGTGNVTAAGTLATVNSNVGSFGSATAAGTFTVNGKGLITAAGSTTVTPAVGSITGLGTGVGTALAVNVGSAGAPVVNGGVLGTPSSGTLTNATGLPIAGLTASTVTALGVGSIELGHATDTTLARVSAGVVSIEGNNILVSGGALGTPASGVATNLTGTATGLTSGITNALKSATTTVDVSASTAPSTGYVLTATDSTHATWQAAAGGSTININTTKVDQTPASGGTYGTLAGSVNSSNALFTVSNGAYAAGSLEVTLNGQVQTQGASYDFVETTPASGTFTFNVAPTTGDIIQVAYIVPSSGSGTTGSGSVVLATSPTLITPILGVAAATTINKVTLTAPATGSTLTVADGKTLTASNTVTLTGTDGVSIDLTNTKKRTVGGVFDGGGSAITNGTTSAYVSVPFAGTITAYTILTDTGTCTIKTWKKATGTAVPTVSDSISTSGVSLSTGTAIRSTTVSDFTSTTVTANDIFAFNITAISGATKITFELEITAS